MAERIKALFPPSDSRQFLSSLKQTLETLKSLENGRALQEALVCLVSLYLDCPAKIAAKRVIASFFQNQIQDCQSLIVTNICEQLSERLDWDFTSSQNGPDSSVRHTVDSISAIMENFKMGEQCMMHISLKVIRFLVKAGQYFLSQVHDDVPPVHLNEVMHHCHSTVQTLNLVMQKTLVDCTDLRHGVTQDFTLMTEIMDLDLHILKNELFLLDCRCCCAMNAVLLLQLSSQSDSQKIPSLMFPSSCNQENGKRSIDWLSKDQTYSFNMENMTCLSYLAMAFGYIAVVSPHSIVTADQMGSHFYLDVLLTNLLDYGIKCKETVSKALYGKIINLWTSKMLNTVQTVDCSKSLFLKLKGDSPSLQSLLGYVWTYWDDQLDVIRQSTKTVFENILKIHSLVSSGKFMIVLAPPAQVNGDEPNAFIWSILNHLFSVSWTSRGKFSALTSCVNLVGTTAILERRGNLPSEVLQQLQEQALSCYASELYAALFTSHQQELSTCKQAPDDWKGQVLQTWMGPVVGAMCSHNKKLKQNIIEYLLPKLMKSEDQILNYMISKLSSASKDDTEPCYGAIIMCLRRARVLGLLRPSPVTDDESFLWYGHLHPDVLKSALCSLDEQIRMDAFALLCENHKTAGAITEFEFNMLKFFIPHNLNNQSPAFRQSLISLLKKLFFRLKESMGALRRLAKKEKESGNTRTSIMYYEMFLTFLANHLLCSLYPGSAFARRTTSLAILSLLITYFQTDKDGFVVTAKLLPEHRQALLECLADTFEDNKKEALNILSMYIMQQGPIWDKQGLAATMKVSFSLACSTRPQDCSTAVYNFLLILKQQQCHSSLCNLAEVMPLDTLPPSVDVTSLKTSNTPLFLLSVLLLLLDDQINVANQSLITAAANRPMYPTLHCIRYIMQELDFKLITADAMPAARKFISDLIRSCLNLSEVVSPVVQNSSPEGNVPEDAIMGPGLSMTSIVETDTSHPQNEGARQTLPESVLLSRALVESMPEYLVVCCWRSIKEVSLTLGRMCLQLPVSKIMESDEDQSLLCIEQVKIIGEYFTQQLLESIHRGAFELAYAGFQLMCQMLWKHPVAAFHHLPAQWLGEVMVDIKSDDPNSRLCSTRRSAGVPFFVQAITSTEPAATGRKCFHIVMKELLLLAAPKSEDEQSGGIDSNAQVHALNILRTLFRDARLGEDVVPYVADGLKAAILGFKSGQWAVRNSATLLLSALMTRMFGVKRSKDETAMSKKNCQTGRSFFHRYPSLYPFLLRELEEATADVGSRDKIHLHPSLYPVLLVLGRLFPSTLEGSDTSLSLSAFIPYVIKCASSPVYKTRIIASRALQPLARRNQVAIITQQLLNSLPESAADQKISSSHIHGSLLQLCQLMNLVKGLPKSMHGDILDIALPGLCKRSWLISCENRCYASLQVALLLVDTILETAASYNKKTSENIQSIDILTDKFFQTLTSEKSSDSVTWQPFFFDFERTKARLCLKHLARLGMAFECADTSPKLGLATGEDLHHGADIGKKLTTCEVSGNTSYLSKYLLLRLLKSPFYEVRLGVLETLCGALGVGYRDLNHDSDDTAQDSALEGNSKLQDEETISETEDTNFIAASTDPGTGLSYATLQELTIHLFDQLLEMAVHKETHHECLEKVYLLLASLPDCTRLLINRGMPKIHEILATLMAKMRSERRMENKAAMMRFSGCLVSPVYDSITSSGRSHDQSCKLLRDWIDILEMCSREEDCPDLHISCCCVLLNNVMPLLCDPDDKLGSTTFLCWSSLACLLQEDDLEVKDVAASVLCLVEGLKTGSYHPSYALHRLPSALITVHAERNLSGVILCLLQWIMFEAGADVKESSDRLFDKGEMNTYWDQVAFTRSIAKALMPMVGLDLKGEHSSLLNTAESYRNGNTSSTSNQSEGTRTNISVIVECMKDNEVFCQKWKDIVSSLSSDLSLFSGNCEKTDVYMNCGRYMSLCQTVYRARVLLLFDIETLCNSDVYRQECVKLRSIVSSVIDKFNVRNVVTI